MNSRRRGFSLLEVVIATAILLGVVTVTYMLLASSTTESTYQSAHLALDDQARDTLAQMASELRLICSALPTKPPGMVAGPGPVGQPWWDPPPGSLRMRSLDLTFNVATGVDLRAAGGAPTSNTTIRYRWVRETFPSTPGGAVETEANGVDDDLDGLVDEGNVEKTVTVTSAVGPPRVTTSIVCRDVLYPREDPPLSGQAIGFWFEWDGAPGLSPPPPVRISIALQRTALVRKEGRNMRITRTAQTTASRRN